jgi:plasmid stabilization system protein ParE
MPSSIDVIVSASADRNLQQILTYTEKKWGTGQRDAYRQVLLDAFRRLGTHPDIGRPIEGRSSDIREYIVRSHVIRYRREPDRIVILRIVNPRRRSP